MIVACVVLGTNNGYSGPLTIAKLMDCLSSEVKLPQREISLAVSLFPSSASLAAKLGGKGGVFETGSLEYLVLDIRRLLVSMGARYRDLIAIFLHLEMLCSFRKVGLF